MSTIDELRDRVVTVERIREGFATHLGASLYEVTKDDESFRAGRESLYDGIAACDAKKENLLKRIAELVQAENQPEAQVAVDAPEPQEEAASVETPTPNVCPNCGNRVEPTHRFCMTCGHKLAE